MTFYLRVNIKWLGQTRQIYRKQGTALNWDGQ